jgi:HEPN domain-containing protein
VNSIDDVQYRLGLAEGFLKEAEQDLGLKRWRSCVDNSQLAVENSGKAVLALFGVPSKTHEPAKHLAVFLENRKLPNEIHDTIKDMLPDLLTLGLEEHFMTDYGDESSYVLPWDLYDEGSAVRAVEAARRCYAKATYAVRMVREKRIEE